MAAWSSQGYSYQQNLNQINPFTSDGCSGFVEGTATDASVWSYCCEIHDIAYWAGMGGEPAHATADQELRQCISDTGFPNVAAIVYRAVRLMKVPNTTMPLTFRWGYGWPVVMGYRNLNQLQFFSIKDNLPTIIEGIISYRMTKNFPAPTMFELQAIGAKILELEQQIDQL